VTQEPKQKKYPKRSSALGMYSGAPNKILTDPIINQPIQK